MSARITALAGLVGAFMLALGGAAGTPSAVASESSDAAAHAGAFLERELAAGGHVFDYPGTDQADFGVTIDAVLALAATGTGPAEASAATRQLETHLDDYLGPAFGTTELYAGPVAKTALLAMTMGQDPRGFAGRDLLSDLADLQTSGGRYADRTAYTDTSNTFTQGLALAALVRAGEQVPSVGVEFLLDQRCTDGGFKLFVESDECTSDPDATALAVVALLAVDDAAAESAAQAGLDFLVDRLDADGGIGGGVGAESANTNSTGLAAMAFTAGGRAAERERADGFLTSMQLDCTAPAAARGAIAYDADAHAALVAAGAGAQVSDQERRATSQAAFGLAGADLLTVSIEGATPGSDGCSGGPGTSPPPTSTPPNTSSPPSTSAPPASTTTVTTTVTAPPARAVTVTVTENAAVEGSGGDNARSDDAGDEASSDDLSAAGGAASVSATASTSATSAAPASGAMSTIAPTGAAAPAATASTGEPANRIPYLLAGGMVLLGAAAAAYILTRGRT